MDNTDSTIISMDLRRYETLYHKEMLLGVIDNLLDVCSDSIEFHTLVRHILRDKEGGEK